MLQVYLETRSAALEDLDISSNLNVFSSPYIILEALETLSTLLFVSI